MSIKGNAESNILRGRISDPDVIHGKSAYEIDVMHGYDGTEEEWLKEVRGDFDDRVAEAKAEFNAEVDNVIVPDAKAELEVAKENAIAEVADAETNSLKVLGDYTNESKEVLEQAASVLGENEVLLWENPDTTASFTSGTITPSFEGISKEDIDSIRVVFFTRTIGDTVLPSVQVEFGQTGRIHFDEGFTGEDGARHSRSYLRDFLVHSNGNIQFEGGDPDNSICIPYKIYGVKNTEVNLTKTIEGLVAQTTGNSTVKPMSQKATTSYLSQHDKRITNLEKGNISSPFETDDSVEYTKDVPLNALPFAEVSKVGGMTYDDGSVPELKSAKVTELKIVGSNLFDDVWKYRQKGFTPMDDGSWACYSLNEPIFYNTSGKKGSMYINVTAKTEVSGSVMYIVVYYTDGTAKVGCDVIPTATNDFVNFSMITDASKTVDYIKWTYGSGGLYHLKGISISFADTSEYIPYTETSFPIPVEVQTLDGYGEGLSTDCHNYIDWDKKQFVKRVGKVDMGSLDWNYNSTTGCLSSSALPVASAIKASGKCIAYSVVSKDYRDLESGEMIVRDSAYSNSAVLVVKDSYYTDEEIFKNSMSGVWVYYELATPEVTDISDLLSVDNYIGVEGGGTITAVNEYEFDVPTEITYQIKGVTV